MRVEPVSKFDQAEQEKRKSEHQQALEYSALIGKLIGAIDERPDSTINIACNALENTLETMSKNGLDLSPDFQRGHVWTQEQQIAYCESLIRQTISDSGRTITFNNPCYAGHQADDSDLEGTVILDGLQRLTAVRRLMNKDFKVFPVLDGGVHWDFFNNTRFNLLSPHNGLLFQTFCMQHREDILKYYIAFNDGGTSHSKEEIDRVKALLVECQEKHEQAAQ